MRRSDRAVLDDQKIDQVINDCQVCRIGFYDQGEIYIVPLSFGYVFNQGKRVFYFHGAKEGRKIELIKQSNKVGFELDTNYQLQPGSLACQYSAKYISIIGTGNISMIEDDEEKRQAMQIIMLHHTQKDNWEFKQKMLDATAVFKLVVNEISCKEHL